MPVNASERQRFDKPEAAKRFGIVGSAEDCPLGEMQTFIDADLLERLRAGPLAPYFDSYLRRIEREDFLPSSVPMQMYAIARFSNWLQIVQLDLHQVDESVVERFLKRDPNIVHSGESAPLRRFLALLREIGLTAARPPESQELPAAVH